MNCYLLEVRGKRVDHSWLTRGQLVRWWIQHCECVRERESKKNHNWTLANIHSYIDKDCKFKANLRCHARPANTLHTTNFVLITLVTRSHDLPWSHHSTDHASLWNHKPPGLGHWLKYEFWRRIHALRGCDRSRRMSEWSVVVVSGCGVIGNGGWCGRDVTLWRCMCVGEKVCNAMCVTLHGKEKLDLHGLVVVSEATLIRSSSCHKTTHDYRCKRTAYRCTNLLWNSNLCLLYQN